jgi:cation:H+ antiporter
MNDYLALAVGVLCAGIGGELFVRGVVGIALWARISAGIVGATVAAFATSSPELSVAVISALSKKPEISLGAALGSNVVNVAVILAIPVIMTGIKSSPGSVQRDFPFALAAPILTAVLALDGELSRMDGALLLIAFMLWLGIVMLEVRRQRSVAEKVLGERRGWLAILLSLIGFLCLVAAGRFFVSGAMGIALSFGIDEFIIGATIVAIGTSLPELATSIISKIRGHDEVGVGTILGSNIFNGLFIIAVTALIYPIKINLHEVLLALAFGLVTVLLIWPPRHGFIHRSRGLLLLLIYAIYVIVTVEK